jgi:hypothetical protein
MKKVPNIAFIELLLTTLWLGGTVLIGFVAVPVIFASINDRVLAGMVAGEIFTILRYISIGIMVALVLLQTRYRNMLKQWAGRLLIVILLLLLLDQFWLHPAMVELKANGLAKSERFAQMHHTASTLFSINALLGIVFYYVLLLQQQRFKMGS